MRTSTAAKVDKNSIFQAREKNYLYFCVFINKNILISTTRAIVLHHLRYGESNLIVHLYTESMGRQSVFVKGVSGKKSHARIALFQPLHLLEGDLHHSGKRQIQRISKLQIYCQLQSIPFDPVKSCIALFIAEVLCKTLKEEEANPGLFHFLHHAIQTLDLIEHGTANFHIVFLVHYSRYLGFYNNHILPKLLETSFEHLDSLQLNHHQRNDLTEYLLNYYTMHVDNFGKMKSFPVLQNVFL